MKFLRAEDVEKLVEALEIKINWVADEFNYGDKDYKEMCDLIQSLRAVKPVEIDEVKLQNFMKQALADRREVERLEELRGEG